MKQLPAPTVQTSAYPPSPTAAVTPQNVDAVSKKLAFKEKKLLQTLAGIKLDDTKQPNSGLVELTDLLEKIDTNSPLAKLNETTISDNNGGRIYF